MRQKIEDVGTFYNWLEKLFHLTVNVQTKDKERTSSEIIQDILKAQTINTFIEGLRHPINMLVKISHLETIENFIYKPGV